jgi:hypothetical protein
LISYRAKIHLEGKVLGIGGRMFMLVGIMNSRRFLTIGCGVIFVLAQLVLQPWVGLPKDVSAIYTQEMASTDDDWVAEDHNVTVDWGEEGDTSEDNDSRPTSRTLLCERIGADRSFLDFWEKEKPPIAAVSLLHAEGFNDIRSNALFTDWVAESMSYFTHSRLQRSALVRPIDSNKSFRRIRTIIETKLRNPVDAPPLRLTVFGGSATAGHQCLINKFDYPVRVAGSDEDVNTPIHKCAWPGRLQDMMDAILGEGIVEVRNVAAGGATTSTSTMVVEYSLLPGPTPDVIFWDHGVNDALQQRDAPEIFEELLQPFYRATRTLQTCEQDAPLVVMVDTFLGEHDKIKKVSKSMEVAAAVYRMVSWYPDTLGISYANTVRPYVLSHLSSRMDPLSLLGSRGLFVHPGMMYHISVAWVVLFNMLQGLHDTCNAPAVDDNQEVLDNSTVNHHLDGFDIPELDGKLTYTDVHSKWKEHGQKRWESCADRATDDSNNTTTAPPRCFYAWIVNQMTNVAWPRDIVRELQPALVANERWSAQGFPIRQPRTGWFAEGRGSWFELAFTGIPASAKYLNLVYMKSYSENWYNATLVITCFVDGPKTNTTTRLENISGYQLEQTSILVPTKLALPPNQAGDNMRLKFELIEGETFKIIGMALC